jgi:hypothetical protein
MVRPTTAVNVMTTIAKGAQTAATIAAKKADDIAALAAKKLDGAGKQLLKKSDDAAALAAKKADDVAAAAAKKADDVAGAAGKKADDVGSLIKKADPKDVKKLTIAERAAKTAKDISGYCGKNPVICMSPMMLGGLAYLDDQFQDIADDTKACTAVCLPENMHLLESSGAGGLLADSDVKYTTIESIQQGGPNGEGAKPDFSAADVPGKQPLCSADMELSSCTDYCYDTCSGINAYDGPGAGLIKGAKSAAKSVIGGALDIVGDTLDGIFGGAKWYVVGFVVLLILLGVMKMMSGPRRP